MISKEARGRQPQTTWHRCEGRSRPQESGCYSIRTTQLPGSSVRTPGSTYRAERPTTKEYRIPMRKPPRPRLKPAQAQLPIGPSSTLLRFANKIASSDGGLVLDVACGYGRNAIAVAARGYTVVCVDRDLSRLNILERLKTEYIKSDAQAEYKSGKILPVCASISLHKWSFSKCIFNAVICVHFV